MNTEVFEGIGWPSSAHYGKLCDDFWQFSAILNDEKMRKNAKFWHHQKMSENIKKVRWILSNSHFLLWSRFQKSATNVSFFCESAPVKHRWNLAFLHFCVYRCFFVDIRNETCTRHFCNIQKAQYLSAFFALLRGWNSSTFLHFFSRYWSRFFAILQCSKYQMHNLTAYYMIPFRVSYLLAVTLSLTRTNEYVTLEMSSMTRRLIKPYISRQVLWKTKAFKNAKWR